VRAGSRALDILTALVERPGELVGKHELMARVWRGTFVEEGNLKFQVGALRRALRLRKFHARYPRADLSFRHSLGSRGRPSRGRRR